MARVLVVDDEVGIQTAVERLLTRAGHTVDTAGSAEQARRLASERAFDVVLVDYHLGPEDGVTVLQRLRELQPGCLRILMSGRLDLPTIIHAINHGEVTRVLRKPISGSALNQAVEDVLAAREAMRKLIHLQEATVSRKQRAHLVECLENDDIMLAAQPIVRAETGAPFAHECLLRSRHPILDGPLPLLLAAERHDMLGQLSSQVFERAARWLARLEPSIKLFVNVHPDELADGAAFLDRLHPLVGSSERVVLEITERNRLHGIANWERTVDAITDAGFALAVDDLGAGYSSLSVLAELQPAYVKVDMSIVRNIDTDARKQRLVDLLVRFADATGATLVAEGVETEGEAAALRSCGAHLLQGYLFGRPKLHPDDCIARPHAAR
jgi:EAL domain-containing protein (putative c-di-GMP-specific phosphodiesterase class I)/CheY-like chemotaxis protein